MKALPRFLGSRHTARTLALQVLLDCRRRNGFVQELLDRNLVAADLSPADRRLATQLAYGVLRRRGTLQALIEPLVARPLEKVEPWLWDVLRLGAYQLALLDHIPAHAALNETVELASSFGRPAAAGFLNGVLRALSRLTTADGADGPAANALPLANGAYRLLARPVLPDPASRPVEYIASGFGLPTWLIRRWAARYPLAEVYRLGFWFAGPAALALRVNPLRCTRDHYLAACRAAGVAAEPGEHPQAVRLRENVPIRDLPGYAEGWFSVQDESAMFVASTVAPETDMTVLDLCAAPGGKATHLAELMQDRGRVVACDTDADRLPTLNALAGRLGLTSIETRKVSRSLDDIPAGPFDAVLADVPCSNTGVLGRRPETRDRLRPSDLPELAALQERLLHAALDRVRPGGVVVYSTCSIEPEENGSVVRRVAGSRPEFCLEQEAESVPGKPADGGYRARLRRTDPRSGGSSMATNVDPSIRPVVPTPAPAANGAPANLDAMPIIAIDMPVMYEDEGQDEMGESDPHTIADHILRMGIIAHLKSRPEFQVFSNLNVYYHPIDRWAYVSPDLMVVMPNQPLRERLTSYRIGVQGPAPVLAIEILSRRSFQQQDLALKPMIYSRLAIPEYILVDGTGEFLERRLLLRRLQADGGWRDEQDADGGVTSQLGFRILLEDDNNPRVIDTASGKPYVRPEEAQESLDAARTDAEKARNTARTEAEARRQAEERAKALEAELNRLRRQPPG